MCSSVCCACGVIHVRPLLPRQGGGRWKTAKARCLASCSCVSCASTTRETHWVKSAVERERKIPTKVSPSYTCVCLRVHGCACECVCLLFHPWSVVAVLLSIDVRVVLCIKEPSADSHHRHHPSSVLFAEKAFISNTRCPCLQHTFAAYLPAFPLRVFPIAFV